MNACLRVALLGAESSGKTTLAADLGALPGALWVPEYLREFVALQGRVPCEHEQLSIARTQRAREEAAAARCALLWCDTTPLMTALYSQHYWGRVEPALAALAADHPYQLTLVTAPEAPWQADGLQRESDAVRLAMHATLLAELARRGWPYVLLCGTHAERRAHALALVAAETQRRAHAGTHTQ